MKSTVFDAKTNIISSLRLFDAAIEAKIKRIVFASSGGTVYGIPNFLPVTEQCPTSPICAYGVSKLAIENYLSLYNQSEGISLRIGNPYGPYQLRGTSIGIIANFLNATLSHEEVEVWGDGSVVRDYLYIDDVADAFARAITCENLTPGSYNVGSGIGHSIKEILDTITLVTGHRLKVNYRAGRGFDVPKIVLNSRKLNNATDWQANTNLEVGISSMWQKLLGGI